MCVIFFYVDSNPPPGGYKLILASNRDEFFSRPTQPVAQWDQSPSRVYGGIDLEPGREGGTWLAIGGHDGIFKVGALLNLTGEPRPRNAEAQHKHTNNHQTHNHRHQQNGTSVILPRNDGKPPAAAAIQLPLHDNHLLLGRGMLVSNYVSTVTEGSSIEAYNRCLVGDCIKYSAFNFVSIEIGQRTQAARVSICSNVPPTLEQYGERKCYGFGNSLPAVPFEKVRLGQEKFECIVDGFNAQQHILTAKGGASAEQRLIAQLQELLKSKHKHWPDPELLRRAPNWGEHLSALNVNVPHENYGSRTHTVILIDGQDRLVFVEETMTSLDPQGEWKTTCIEEHFTSTASQQQRDA